MKKYIEPKTLKEWSYLPNKWNHDGWVTQGLNDDNCKSFGWKIIEIPEPEPEPYPVIVKYSKRLVMRKMKTLGIWEQAKQIMIENDFMDDWNSSVNLDPHCPEFQTASKKMASLLPYGITLDEFLVGCEYNEY